MPNDTTSHPPACKQRDLSKDQRIEIRARIDAGQTNARILALEFDCSPQQIAGIKAHMTIQGYSPGSGKAPSQSSSKLGNTSKASTVEERFELTLMDDFGPSGMVRCIPPSVAVALEEPPRTAVADLWTHKRTLFVRITGQGRVVHTFASDVTGQPWTKANIRAFIAYMSDVLRDWLTDGVGDALYAKWRSRELSILWDKDSRFPATPKSDQLRQCIDFTIKKNFSERPGAEPLSFSSPQERDAYARWLNAT
jgi:hypothetical protein